MSDNTTPERNPNEEPLAEGDEFDTTEVADDDSEADSSLTDEDVAQVAKGRYGDLGEAERNELIRSDLERAKNNPNFGLDPWVKNYYAQMMAPISNQISAAMAPFQQQLADSLRDAMPKLGPTLPAWQIGLSTNDLLKSYSRESTPDAAADENSERDGGALGQVGSELEHVSEDTSEYGKAALYEYRKQMREESRQQTEHLGGLLAGMGDQVSAVQRLGEDMQAQTRAVVDQTDAHARSAKWQTWLTILTLAVATATLLANMISRPEVTIELPPEEQPSEPTVVESGSP